MKEKVVELKKKHRIAILTPGFTDFRSGYSLSGIVLDQARMLSRFGHEVSIFVSEQFNAESYQPIDGVAVEAKIPFARLIDYQAINDYCRVTPEDFSEADMAQHKTCQARTCEMLLNEMPAFDIVLTHDICLTGWHLPHYLGLQDAAEKLDKVRWLHWIHSVPTHGYDWWNIERLGHYHKLVFPSRADRQLTAEAFRGRWEDVRTIPHIKDIRILNRFLPESWEFIDRYPTLLQADIVQVYPASADRLDHKRVRELILIFKNIKALGLSVCLVIANQWATTRQRKQDCETYKQLALNNGLTFKEVIFTSDFKPEWEVGVPQDVLVDFYHCGNLFVFPTAQESFGLVLPEALLTGGCLPVTNLDVEVLGEILKNRGMRFSFGSLRRTLQHDENSGGEARYLSAIAAVIAQRIMDEEGIASRTICRQSLNMDYLYHRHYLPIFQEAQAW